MSIISRAPSAGGGPAEEGPLGLATRGHREGYRRGALGALVEGPEAAELSGLGRRGRAVAWCGAGGGPLGPPWEGATRPSLSTETTIVVGKP